MAQIKGTNVIAPVVPFDTADVHPSHEALYGKGGYRTVAATADRDAIPAARREAGMLVYVTADETIYTLGSDLTTWTALELGGEFVLEAATASVLGGVKIGTGVTITDGVISVSTDYAATSHTHDTLTSGTDTLSLDGAGAITFTHSPGGGALEFPQSTGGIARIVAPSTQGLGIYSGNAAEPVYFYTVDNKSLGGVYVGTVEFPDKTTQTTAWLGSVDWASVNSKPTFFDGAYSSLTGTPTLGTAAAANTGDFAAASHSHAASAINSGTLDIARIPTGTSSATVCVGNDSRLSDARTPTAHNQAWSTITSTPTTRSGYGITDAQKTITSGTAAPTGGSDGDIYLQYT